MTEYKVCILAAGVGNRIGEFSQHLNKALIPVQGKPAICHIIEKFPEDIEIVIAVGHLKESLKTYITTAYPKRKITCVSVIYEGPGTGPGYSLLQCKEFLQCPFIFFAADTLIRENVPVPEKNWFGLAEVPNTERFCSAEINKAGIVSRIDDKIKCNNKHAFIGLAGVKDYVAFWNALENNKTLIANEIQVSNGFSALLQNILYAEIFTWFDTGTYFSYTHALENYPHGKGYQGE